MSNFIEHSLIIPQNIYKVNNHKIPQQHDRYGKMISWDCLWNIFTYCIEHDASIGTLSKVCRNWSQLIKNPGFALPLLQIHGKVSLEQIKAVTLHLECPAPLLRFAWNVICNEKFLKIQNTSVTWKEYFFRSESDFFKFRMIQYVDWLGTLSKEEAFYVTSMKLNFCRKIERDARFLQILRILKFLPNLRKLELDAYDFTSKQISRIVALCPNVRDSELTINCSLQESIFSTLMPFANEKTYRLCIKQYPAALFNYENHEILTQFISRTSSLQFLTLNMRLPLNPFLDLCIMHNPKLMHINLRSAQFDDEDCMLLADECTMLRTLELNINPPVTNEGIASILLQCTQLSSLTLWETQKNDDIDASILDVVESQALSLKKLGIHYAREKTIVGEIPPLAIKEERRRQFKISRPDLQITYVAPKPMIVPLIGTREPGGPLR